MELTQVLVGDAERFGRACRGEHIKIRDAPDFVSQRTHEALTCSGTGGPFDVVGGPVEDCLRGLDRTTVVRSAQQVVVGGRLGKVVALAICPICVGRTKGAHVEHLDLVHGYAGNRRAPLPDGLKELGLARAVAADEDGKVR